MANYTRRVFFGVSIVLVMNGLANLVAYLTRIYLARNLTPGEYGLFYSVFTVVIFALFFRDLGLGTALTKYISEFNIKGEYHLIKASISITILFQLISSSFLAILFIALANYLASHYFKNPDAVFILHLLVFYIFTSVLFRIPKSIFKGFQNFKIFSLFELSKNSLVLIFMIVLFYFGVEGAVVPAISFVLGSFLLFLILLPLALKMFPYFTYSCTKKDITLVSKKMFFFGMPVLFTGIGSKIIGYVDTLLLTHLSTLEQVGIYNVVLPSAMFFLFVGTAISAVVFPIASELWAKKEKKKMAQGIQLLYKYTFFTLLLPIIFLSLFSSELIYLLFGEAYVTGSIALGILLFGVMFYTVAGINHNILSGIGRPKIVTKIVLFAALINILLNLLLIPLFGIVGAAWATFVSYFIALCLSTYWVSKHVAIRMPILIWVKIYLLGFFFWLLLTFGISFFGKESWMLLIVIGVGTLLYLLFAKVLGIFNVKEIQKYYKLLREK